MFNMLTFSLMRKRMDQMYTTIITAEANDTFPLNSTGHGNVLQGLVDRPFVANTAIFAT